MNKEQRKSLSPTELSNFYGTEGYYRHPLARNILMTDGVYHCFNNGLAWLIDIIATEYRLFATKSTFQTWTLTTHRKEAPTHLIEVTNGNKKILAKKPLEYTDYPYPSFTVWAQDGVLMLPSEY